MSLLVCLPQALQTLQPGKMPYDMQPCFLTSLYTATKESKGKV